MRTDDASRATKTTGVIALQQLFVELLPLTLAVIATALISYFSTDLVHAILGAPPRSGEGYVALALTLLPLTIALAYTEWLANRSVQDSDYTQSSLSRNATSRM